MNKNEDSYHPYLTKEQQRHPQKIIDAFFADIEMAEIKKSLRDCLQVCLTTNNIPFESPNERGLIMYLVFKLEELLDASYLLNEKKK